MFNPILIVKRGRQAADRVFSVLKNHFRHAGRLLKVPEAEQLAPVGVQRYGRARVAMEVKILAKQAGLQQNRSLYVILRNAVTKNPFSTEVRRSFAFAQDDIERNLDSVSVHIRSLVILILTVTGFFDSLKRGRQAAGRVFLSFWEILFPKYCISTKNPLPDMVFFVRRHRVSEK